jgi:hypothetical protein
MFWSRDFEPKPGSRFEGSRIYAYVGHDGMDELAAYGVIWKAGRSHLVLASAERVSIVNRSVSNASQLFALRSQLRPQPVLNWQIERIVPMVLVWP